MTITIEKGVPLPAFTTKGKYPWYDMEVGDSFLARDIAPARRKNFRGMCAAITRRTGLRFRTQVEGDDGVRVWLVEKPPCFVRPQQSRATFKPPASAIPLRPRPPIEVPAIVLRPPKSEPNLASATLYPATPATSLVELRPASAIKDDQGRARSGWKPGLQVRRCETCDCRFNGDRAAFVCADCVYAERISE